MWAPARHSDQFIITRENLRSLGETQKSELVFFISFTAALSRLSSALVMIVFFWRPA